MLPHVHNPPFAHPLPPSPHALLLPHAAHGMPAPTAHDARYSLPALQSLDLPAPQPGLPRPASAAVWQQLPPIDDFPAAQPAYRPPTASAAYDMGFRPQSQQQQQQQQQPPQAQDGRPGSRTLPRPLYYAQPSSSSKLQQQQPPSYAPANGAFSPQAYKVDDSAWRGAADAVNGPGPQPNGAPTYAPPPPYSYATNAQRGGEGGEQAQGYVQRPPGAAEVYSPVAAHPQQHAQQHAQQQLQHPQPQSLLWLDEPALPSSSSHPPAQTETSPTEIKRAASPSFGAEYSVSEIMQLVLENCKAIVGFAAQYGVGNNILPLAHATAAVLHSPAPSVSPTTVAPAQPPTSYYSPSHPYPSAQPSSSSCPPAPPPEEKLQEMVSRAVQVVRLLRALSYKTSPPSTAAGPPHQGMTLEKDDAEIEEDPRPVKRVKGMPPPPAAASASGAGRGGSGGSTAVEEGEAGDKVRPKYRKRSRAAPPAQCASCGIAETPEWRKGPDGARTLCNACGLHFSKLTKLRERNVGPDGQPLGPPVNIGMLRSSALRHAALMAATSAGSAGGEGKRRQSASMSVSSVGGQGGGGDGTRQGSPARFAQVDPWVADQQQQQGGYVLPPQPPSQQQQHDALYQLARAAVAPPQHQGQGMQWTSDSQTQDTSHQPPPPLPAPPQQQHQQPPTPQALHSPESYWPRTNAPPPPPQQPHPHPQHAQQPRMGITSLLAPEAQAGMGWHHHPQHRAPPPQQQQHHQGVVYAPVQGVNGPGVVPEQAAYVR